MKVKIFQASGHDEIRELEGWVNEWLAGSAVQIQHTSTAMCQIADTPTSGERYQHLVVTIWYEDA